MDNQDLKYIKKHYGENFAKLCRGLFSTILEVPGELSRIISEKFDTVPTLYEDVIKQKSAFKNYVFNFFTQKYTQKKHIDKTPEELMDEAGYILYPECKTEDEIQYFRKYFRPSEELCTFNGGRLNSCRVWFAVKKDVDIINREDFPYPYRQDRYGTSVISIQFTRGRHSTLSIKNRYNHAIANPDATFGNDLDNIVPGLTDAFCEKYDIDLSPDMYEPLSLDSYIFGADGKLYKSNMNVFGYSYCANNIVVDANRLVMQYDKSKFILIDNYLVDLSNKKIISLPDKQEDAFIKSIGKIQSINIYIDEAKNRVIEITPEVGEKVQIVVDKLNKMIQYKNMNVKEIGDKFLQLNKNLEEICIPNVEKIGEDFLYSNEKIRNIQFLKVKEIADGFMTSNQEIMALIMPNVKNIGNGFMTSNKQIRLIQAPKLENIGSNFLSLNSSIAELDLPSVKTIGNSFMFNNSFLCEIKLPNVEKVGNNFLYSNIYMKEINLPKLKEVGHNFMISNSNLAMSYSSVKEKEMEQ